MTEDWQDHVAPASHDQTCPPTFLAEECARVPPGQVEVHPDPTWLLVAFGLALAAWLLKLEDA